MYKIFPAKAYFTITAEIHARLLGYFYSQYADRHMNLKFIRRVRAGNSTICYRKNKLMLVFNASALLLIMNFVMTLSKQSANPLGYRFEDPQLL